MNKRVQLIVLHLSIIFALAALFSCEKTARNKESEATEKLASLVFYDSLDMKNIEIITEIVQDDYHRARGLMFRENLPENQGMLFIFDDEAPRYFWMKNTTISLDIIYLNAGSRIIKIHKNTLPLSESLYPSEEPSMYVVEVRADFTERYQINVGDSVSWQEL